MIKNLLLFIGLLSSASILAAQEMHDIEFPWDQSPINLSFLLDAPAGKHGFLGLKKHRFVFEDGTVFRFWGVTVNGSACFPAQNQAPIIAERLSQLGINLVRFQNLDAPWAEPNLFWTAEKTTLAFNPEALDRLDFFLYQLENRGIYAYLDGLDARQLQAGDGVPEWSEIPEGLKGLVHYEPQIQELHQRYLFTLWTHRNRYTHREYRDSPAIAFAELFSENDFTPSNRLIPRFAAFLDHQWVIWCQANQIVPSGPLDRVHPSLEMRRFLTETISQSTVMFYNYLRSISVKALIGSDPFYQDAKDLIPSWGLDYFSNHGIWNPVLARSRWYPNRRMTEVDLDQEGNLFSDLVFAHIREKPFIISAWSYPWPNDYRAELPLWTAATACMQDWQGCIFSTYHSQADYSSRFDGDRLEASGDPAVIGLFPAAALLFLRQDIPIAAKTVCMGIAKNHYYEEDTMTPANVRTTRLIDSVKVEVDLQMQRSRSKVMDPTQPETIYDKKWTPSPRNGLFHDPKRNLALINSPKTQALIGDLKLAQAKDLDYLEISTPQEFGVICISSLDNKPIPNSKDMLVTVASEARTTGFISRKESTGCVVIKSGTGPIRIPDTAVNVRLLTKQKDWRISVLDGSNSRAESIPYTYQEQRLRFSIGNHGTLHYRLTWETTKKIPPK